MAVVFAITLPFPNVQLVWIEAFFPATQSVMCAADLLTAALLFSQYSVYPQRAVLALASGYVFSGLFAFLEACAFPGVFAQTSLIYTGQANPAVAQTSNSSIRIRTGDVNDGLRSFVYCPSAM